MRLIPRGHFVFAKRHVLEQDVIEVPNQDDEGKWLTIQVKTVGHLVDMEYLPKDSIAMAKQSDINFIFFNGEEYLYIDEEFIVRVEP